MNERLAADLMILTDRKTIVRAWGIGPMVENVVKFKAEQVAVDKNIHPHIGDFQGVDMLIMYQPGPAFEKMVPIDGDYQDWT